MVCVSILSCECFLLCFCLILSWDIGTNPGPVYKLCSECDSHIHMKKKVCFCGYVICIKSRTFIKITSPPVSTISVKSSDACTQKTGCALLLLLDYGQCTIKKIFEG